MAAPPSSPAAGNRFDGAAGNQFGSPPTAAPAAPFGAPAQGYPGGYPLQPYGPPKRNGLPVWAIVAICVPLAFIAIGILAAIAIPVFLNARNTPVAPDQLGGLSVSADPLMNQTVASISNELAKDAPNAKREVAAYGTLSHGFFLMAFNSRVDPDQEFRDLGATGTWQLFGDVHCATSANGDTSLCLHTSLRGAVEVVAFGTVDLAMLAAVTDEAWAAQPFGG